MRPINMQMCLPKPCLLMLSGICKARSVDGQTLQGSVMNTKFMMEFTNSHSKNRANSRFVCLATQSPVQTGDMLHSMSCNMNDSSHILHCKMRLDFLWRVWMGTSALGEAISVQNCKTLPVSVDKNGGPILICLALRISSFCIVMRHAGSQWSVGHGVRGCCD